jgi:hypothetical protein
MNKILNTNQIENSDLRELSHAEQLKVSGGNACYKFPQGSGRNFDRFRVANQSSINQEKFSGGRWNFVKQFSRDVSFGAFCKRGNFTYFF